MNETFDLLKAHIEAFTRKDGSVVQAHDDKRTAAKAPDKGAAEKAHKEYSEASGRASSVEEAANRMFNEHARQKDNGLTPRRIGSS
jgi:hypothetical protein